MIYEDTGTAGEAELTRTASPAAPFEPVRHIALYDPCKLVYFQPSCYTGGKHWTPCCIVRNMVQKWCNSEDYLTGECLKCNDPQCGVLYCLLVLGLSRGL
jgi:hypothetical protein